MDIQTFYKMKREFFSLKEELTELQRAINSRDRSLIRELVRKRYKNLQAIYQLCDEENEKGSG